MFKFLELNTRQFFYFHASGWQHLHILGFSFGNWLTWAQSPSQSFHECINEMITFKKFLLTINSSIGFFFLHRRKLFHPTRKMQQTMKLLMLLEKERLTVTCHMPWLTVFHMWLNAAAKSSKRITAVVGIGMSAHRASEPAKGTGRESRRSPMLQLSH